MSLFDAVRSESNFQMLEIKHEAEASAFHLETCVGILSNTVDTAIVFALKLIIKCRQCKDNGPIHTY